jgi:nitrogen fixation NifU-like protein
MSDDIRELYQELILEHGRHPHNCKKPSCTNREAEGYNPLCGDTLKLYLLVENDHVADVGFEGDGCAISVASASLMTDAIKGKSIEECHQLFGYFHDMIMDKSDLENVPLKLKVLAGVKTFPARVKCATLAWHTLENALKQVHVPATTE